MSFFCPSDAAELTPPSRSLDCLVSGLEILRVCVIEEHCLGERASQGREESARLAFRCEILTDPLCFCD